MTSHVDNYCFTDPVYQNNNNNNSSSGNYPVYEDYYPPPVEVDYMQQTFVYDNGVKQPYYPTPFESTNAIYYASDLGQSKRFPQVLPRSTAEDELYFRDDPACQDSAVSVQKIPYKEPEKGYVKSEPSSPSSSDPNWSESSPPQSTLSNDKTARKQVKRACLNCRRSKTACSFSRPCMRCVQQGLQEECVDVPRKRREKKKILKLWEQAIQMQESFTVQDTASEEETNNTLDVVVNQIIERLPKNKDSLLILNRLNELRGENKALRTTTTTLQKKFSELAEIKPTTWKCFAQVQPKVAISTWYTDTTSLIECNQAFSDLITRPMSTLDANFTCAHLYLPSDYYRADYIRSRLLQGTISVLDINLVWRDSRNNLLPLRTRCVVVRDPETGKGTQLLLYQTLCDANMSTSHLSGGSRPLPDPKTNSESSTAIVQIKSSPDELFVPYGVVWNALGTNSSSLNKGFLDPLGYFH